MKFPDIYLLCLHKDKKEKKKINHSSQEQTYNLT